MPKVSIPKDLSSVKTKLFFNLTRRQLICFGAAALIGFPVFFAVRSRTDVSTAAFVMILIMLPCFLFAMVERNGQGLEVMIRHYVSTRYRRPRRRLYQTKSHTERKGSTHVQRKSSPRP